MLVKGFTMKGTDTYPHDEYVLATTKEEVAMLKDKLSVLDYHRHRIPRLKKIIHERVYTQSINDDYDASAKARVDFSIKCLAFSEKQLERYREEPNPVNKNA